MTKAYLVAMPIIKDNDMFAKEYASKVADTIKPFQGKFLARTPNKLIKEGEEKIESAKYENGVLVLIVPVTKKSKNITIE